MKTTSIIKIGGHNVPPISSLHITHEAIWSKNTGRGANGEMIGDIVGRKWKIEIGFAPLSYEQAGLIDDLISEPFFQAEFIDPKGTRRRATFYAGNHTYPVYSYVEGLPRYTGAALNLIEK